MGVSDFFGSSKTIKAVDLKGKAHKVVIENVGMQVFDSGKKVVLKLYGQEKGFVLNKTNMTSIAQMHNDSEEGEDFEKYVSDLQGLWRGKEIVIFPTQTDFNGETVDCIRVKVEVDVAEGEIPF